MKIYTNLSRRMNQLVIILGLALLLLILAVAGLVIYRPDRAGASSHREAPLISQDPNADTTDVYAFVDPNDSSLVTLIANWIPFEGPEGGPNYHRFADDVLYELHIDNDGDASSELTYQFRFSTTGLDDLSTFLYNTGGVTSLTDPDLTVKQTFVVTEQNFSTSVTKTLGAGLEVPPVNIGDKSTPDYESNFDAGATVHDLVDGGVIGKVFAGPRDDPFFVDLGSIFDLISLRGQAPPIGYDTPTKGIDGLSGYNVHSIALQLPISRVTSGGEDTIGVWATSSRQAMRTLVGGLPTNSGNFVQISRLGMPLTNEVVVPLALKDVFNGLEPDLDLTVYTTPPFILQDRVENPELARLLCGLYGVSLPDDGNLDCVPDNLALGTPRTGRGDIFDIFLTGMKLAPGKTFTITTGGVGGTPVEVPLSGEFNVNQPAGVQPADMLRLNTSISGSLCHPTPQRLGLLAGDACGFPNGRRVADDVVEIEILAVAGAAYQILDGSDGGFTFDPALIGVLTDSVDQNDKQFLSSFPYLAPPHQGQDHFHDFLTFPSFFPIMLKEDSP